MRKVICEIISDYIHLQCELLKLLEDPVKYKNVITNTHGLNMKQSSQPTVKVERNDENSEEDQEGEETNV
jgi:hypothetical protein